MPKQFVQQAFHTWLKQNRNRFHHAPVQIRYIRDWVEFYFTDVIHEISAVINQHGCNIAFTYHNEVWDFLVCFDVSVERDDDGYYCSQCLAQDGDVVEKHFATQAELLADHVFEPLLEWSNERLGEDVFAQISPNGGCTAVVLISQDQMKQELIEKSGSKHETFSSSSNDGYCFMKVIQKSEKNIHD